MAQTPPFRNRPKLHIALSHFNGSPRPPGYATPMSSGASTPNATPFATTAYSPFRSAGLKAPTPYHISKNATPDREKNRYFRRYAWFRAKRMLSSRPVWFLLALLALMLCWFHGRNRALDGIQLNMNRLAKEHPSGGRTKNLQFIPATNPKIHVGWSLQTQSPRCKLIRRSTLGAGRPPQIGCVKTARSQVY